MARTIRSLQADLKATGATKFKRDILTGAAAMSRFSDKAGGLIASLGGLRGAVGAATGVLAAYAGAKGLAGATRASIDFETQTAELAKLLGDLPAKAAAEEISDLATELPVARAELMDVAAAAARLGVRGTENIRTFTQVMAEIGVATDQSAAQAATSMARLSKITETPISQVRNLASVVNEASNTMAASFSEVLDASLRAAPGLSAIGATQPEIVALAGSLTQVSASAQRAGTRLNRMASAIANPENAEAFGAAIGMTAEGFRALVDQSPAEAILALAGAMRAGGAGAELLSREMRETGLKVLRGLAQNLDETTSSLGRMNKAFEEGTSIGEEFARFAGITESRFEQLKNIGTDLATVIGAPLRDALRGAAADLAAVANQSSGFTKLAEIIASTVQTIISGFQVAFNVIEIGVTAAMTTVFELFGQVAMRINDMLRLLNRGAEIVGLDWKFALLDAEGALQLADRGAQAIHSDMGDIVDATMNAAESWGTTLGFIEKAETKTAETETNLQGVAAASGEAASNLKAAAGALPDVRGMFGLGIDFDAMEQRFSRGLEMVRRITKVRAELADIERRAGKRVQEFVSQVRLARIQDEMRQLSQVSRSMASQMTSAFSSIVRGSKSVVAAFADMVDGIIQEFMRLLLQKQLAGLLFSMVGGGIPAAPDTSGINPAPPDVGRLSTAGGVPGFARGGSFRVGGSGGRDSQLVAFRATPGERVDVTPSGGSGGGTTNVNAKVEFTIVANDTRGFDELLRSRQEELVGLVRQGIAEGV